MLTTAHTTIDIILSPKMIIQESIDWVGNAGMQDILRMDGEWSWVDRLVRAWEAFLFFLWGWGGLDWSPDRNMASTRFPLYLADFTVMHY